MKLSDGFKGVFALGKTAAEALSHLHTATDLFGAVMGKEPAKKEGVAQGIHGMFGHADERAFTRLLAKIGRKNKKILIAFFRWHFKRGTYEERLITMYYGNQFRTFIVKKDEPDALKFLGEMVQTITEAGGGVRGYNTLYKELEAQNVPLIPKDSVQAIVAIRHSIRNDYRNTKAGAIRHMRTVERKVAINEARPKSFLDYIIK